MATPTFDLEAAIKGLREGKGLTGKDGVLTPLIKQLTETALQAELENHLAEKDAPNRKNGSTPKTVKSPTGRWFGSLLFTLPSPEALVRFGAFPLAMLDRC